MLYDLTVPQFTKMLRNLNAILGKAAAHAEAKKFDMNVLLNSRLAPDQFNLSRQIQIACDTAKLSVARLTGKDAPVHDDNEVQLPQLKARIESVISFLGTFSKADFTGSEERKISQPRWEGKWLNGHEFLIQHAIPNVYFHITTAYSILRHNGVDIGKKDYLGEMPYRKP
jgi:uncharacterized protein